MKHFLSFVFIVLVCFGGKSTTFYVYNSGNTFSPASLTIAVGDVVVFQLSSNHDAREVSASTWTANGTTSLTGGFQTPYGGGTVAASYLTLGIHYYVCTPHAYLGMKGTITVVSCLPPSQPGTISGPLNSCAGVPVIYSVTPVSGATSYSWSLPGGWTGSSTDNTISVTPNNSSGGMTVAATSTCGSSSERTLAVTVYSAVPTTPSTLTGNTLICSSSFNQYQAGASAGAQSYSWTLPSGWSGTSQLSSIGTLAGSSGGVVSVYGVNVCGLSNFAMSLSVAVTSGTALAAPLAITGNTLICAGTSQQYTVTPVGGATSYSWSFPNGFTGASGNTTLNSVTSGSNSGLVSVTANNICGSSAPKTLSITVSPAAPGAPTPILGNTVLCAGVAGTFSVAPVPTALSYSWSLPGNWTGTSTTSILNFTTGVSTGSLYVWAVNACGNSPVNLLVPVVSTAVPAPGAIQGSTLICPNSAVGYSIAPVAGALEYMWITPTGWTGGSSNNFFGGSANNSGGDIEVHVGNGCGLGMQMLSVTVHTFDPFVTDTDGELNAFPAGETYQWLDCDNNMAEISGETSNRFSRRNGNFAVVITQFGCPDTSACISIKDVGLIETAKGVNFNLFPNPANEVVTISAPANEGYTFVISDVVGRIVSRGTLSGRNTTVDTGFLPIGVYFVTVPGLGFCEKLLIE